MLNGQSDLGRSKDRIHPQAVAAQSAISPGADATFAATPASTPRGPPTDPAERSAGSSDRSTTPAVGTALRPGQRVQALDWSRQGDRAHRRRRLQHADGRIHDRGASQAPVKVVIYNNSALGLITLEAESVGIAPFREAIEFPNPDFAALARACGGHGFTAKKPGDLKGALSEAFAADGPAIVDAVVVGDEMPNIPHLELEQIGHYAVAKIKEAVLAVTG